MSDVADRVKKIVVEHLGVEEDKVVEGASFIDDLAQTASTQLSWLWRSKKSSASRSLMTRLRTSSPLATR